MRKAILFLVPGILVAFFLSTVQPAKSAEKDNRQAMDILQNMARNIAEAKQFNVTLSSSYDAPQANGQMVEFEALRKIQVVRPDKLRVDLQKSGGDQRIMVFDGKQIIIHNVAENVYAREEIKGTVDDAVKHLVSVLKIPLPLARIFRTGLPEEFDKLVERIDYVELNMLTDVPTDHLAVRTRDVDFQIWIAQGEEVLPRRIVITYKNFRGAPQFRANFTNWNFSAKGVKGPFTYSPPKNAELVLMIVRNHPLGTIPVQEGGAK